MEGLVQKVRAPKYCSAKDCLVLVPGGTRNCQAHTTRWDSSTRWGNRHTRPKGWAATRARILKRDEHTCRACGRPGNEVDHIDNLGDDSDNNLWVLCHVCHAAKTNAEALESRLTR